MTLPSPILTALGYDADGLQQLLKPVFAEGTGGEAYFNNTTRRRLVLTDKQVQSPIITTSAGGGLRRIYGLRPDFVSFTGLTAANLAAAKADIQAIPLGSAGEKRLKTPALFQPVQYYGQGDVFAGKTDDDCKRLLQEIDDYVRSVDPRVTQVTVITNAEEDYVLILRSDGRLLTDKRPFVSLRVEVVMTESGRKEQGIAWSTKHVTWNHIFQTSAWKRLADRAIDMAQNNLTSISAPAGSDLEVMVTNGWGGIILHEAFGHGLEADFHMKGIASLQGKLGKRVAAKGVNIVEDGTHGNEIGTLHFDDEGNNTRRNLLVEDGIMIGLMTDEISAAALDLPLTGNGRRESFMHKPMPRMTNTYMLPGSGSTEQLLSEMKNGIYCTSFSGGQVNITTGKFVFMANEARLVENGKLGAFIKGASLQGMGNAAYLGVNGVADNADMVAGFCGKEGQTVSVTVGQPTIRFSAGNITIGGTKA